MKLLSGRHFQLARSHTGHGWWCASNRRAPHKTTRSIDLEIHLDTIASIPTLKHRSSIPLWSTQTKGKWNESSSTNGKAGVTGPFIADRDEWYSEISPNPSSSITRRKDYSKGSRRGSGQPCSRMHASSRRWLARDVCFIVVASAELLRLLVTQTFQNIHKLVDFHDHLFPPTLQPKVKLPTRILASNGDSESASGISG